MNQDLFLAILSMDSYNRGYDAGIRGLNETGFIGTAALAPASQTQQMGWEGTGFYAIAYNWSGRQVVVYRGSDEGRFRDVLLGYPTGAGFGPGPSGN
jgi:hypothetical protein